MTKRTQIQCSIGHFRKNNTIMIQSVRDTTVQGVRGRRQRPPTFEAETATISYPHSTYSWVVPGGSVGD